MGIVPDSMAKYFRINWFFTHSRNNFNFCSYCKHSLVICKTLNVGKLVVHKRHYTLIDSPQLIANNFQSTWSRFRFPIEILEILMNFFSNYDVIKADFDNKV